MWEMVFSVKTISDNVEVSSKSGLKFETRQQAEDFFAKVFSTLPKGQYLSGSLVHNGNLYTLDPTGWGSVWFLKNYGLNVA